MAARPPYFASKTQANLLLKHGEYRKAVDKYNQALSVHSRASSAMLGRSRCHLDLGDFDKALRDIDAAQNVCERKASRMHSYGNMPQKKISPWKAVYQRAEVLFRMGDFEQALVQYHRGQRMRPCAEEFRSGIAKTRAALQMVFPSQLRRQTHRRTRFSEDLCRKAQYNPGTSSLEPNSSMTAEKSKGRALGSHLQKDKDFLKKLLNEIDPVAHPKILHSATDALKYLDTRTAFWKQQIPQHLRSLRKITRRPIVSPINEEADPDSVIRAEYKHVVKQMVLINSVMSQGNYEEAVEKAKSLTEYLSAPEREELPGRELARCNCYSIMGNAYLELGDDKKALGFHLADLQTSTEWDILEGKARALDNLGRVYARIGDFDKAISVWSQKVPITTEPIEQAWLFHELGNCYLEKERYSEARDCGEKSLKAAITIEDLGWQLNTTILIAQAELRQENIQEAHNAFEQAYDLAKLQDDEEAQKRIKEALEDVNKALKEMAMTRGDDKSVGEEQTHHNNMIESQDEEHLQDLPAGKLGPGSGTDMVNKQTPDKHGSFYITETDDAKYSTDSKRIDLKKEENNDYG